jgi:hypothetical protein
MQQSPYMKLQYKQQSLKGYTKKTEAMDAVTISFAKLRFRLEVVAS